MVLALGLLTTRVRSNMAIIRAGVARGQSIAQINTNIRATGQLGIRRVDLSAGVRHAKGVAETGLHIQNIGLNRFPDPSRLAVARTRVSKNYSFDVKIQARSRATGQLQDHYVTVGSDSPMTRQNMIDEAQKYWDEGQAESNPRYESVLEKIEIVAGRRKA